MDNNMTDNGSTAYNKPHQPLIQYSAKGYDEFYAALIQNLKEQGIVPKADDFLNTFIDLISYLGEVLMTYQNAYAQEIYLETCQLRESLFNHAALVDYRINPGSAATGTLVIMAKPGKPQLLPQGFAVSGKEEGAAQPVFFETDTELLVDANYNEFILTDDYRLDQIPIGTSITVTAKISIKPGQYIYFKSNSSSGNFFAQVQSAIINSETSTTTVTLGQFSQSCSLNTGDGKWDLMYGNPRGLMKMESAGAGKSHMWLDNKYEDIAQDSPVIMKTVPNSYYGTVSEFSTDVIPVKTGIKLQIVGSTTTLLPQSEIREVTKVTINWLNAAPATGDYYGSGSGTTATPAEKSANHIIIAGVQAQLPVQETVENTAAINGAKELHVPGDLSALEKYRLLVLNETIAGVDLREEVNVQEVTVGGSGAAAQSIITLQNAISKPFTGGGVKIWGNAVKMTQGKSIPATILGSAHGDMQYQSFSIPQAPLTFVQHEKEGLTADIDITINEIPWRQKNDFLESGPADNDYIIQTDFAGNSSVVFGDGFAGNRPPTGKDNVIAAFRTGQGTAGNVSAGTLKKPVSKPPFLQDVFNPAATSGGSDPDKEDQLRQKIPSQHITFDRVVSLDDYTRQALAFKGIAKARAGLRLIGQKQYVFLAVAGDGGADVSGLLQDLRDYLDARRDINQPLLIQPADFAGVELNLTAIASIDYDKERLRDSIYQALGTGINSDGTLQFFNFDRLDIGMSIHKKDIYRMVENIPGVSLVKELTLNKSNKYSYLNEYFEDFKMIKDLDFKYQMKKQAEAMELLAKKFKNSCSCAGDILINSWELAELDTAASSIEVFYPSNSAACEQSGG